MFVFRILVLKNGYQKFETDVIYWIYTQFSKRKHGGPTKSGSSEHLHHHSSIEESVTVSG